MLGKFKPFFATRRRALATLVGLVLLGFTIPASFLYFDPGRYGMDSPERLAAAYSLGFQPGDADGSPCDWKNPSASQAACMILHPLPRRSCQWQSADFCRPYEISALILDDPRLLGRLVQAVADPCYEAQQDALSADVRQACNQYEGDNTPIIIIFRGPDYDTQMRVDRP